MRTPANHLLFVVFLSAFLGWNQADPGWARRPPGRVNSRADVARASARRSSIDVETPQATRPVQSPPLQAPATVPAPGNSVVVVSTSLGDITLELFKDRAPVSVENFLQYAREGFYADTVFHRVKKGFMIQGGG